MKERKFTILRIENEDQSVQITIEIIFTGRSDDRTMQY